MFAKENPNYLSLDKKWVCEIISIFSLIFSIFVFVVSLLKVKKTITNTLIMQIIFAEILDGINIILAVGIDAHGQFTFNNYPSRMGFCLTQIYLGVFSCLWNLFSSFFISLRIYDRMQNKSKIFKNKFMYEYTTTMSYGIPSVITFFLWASQVIMQSNTIETKTYEDNYVRENKSDFFRYMYCWVSGWNNNTLFIISGLLMAVNFYFSIIKNVFFIGKISREIKESEGEGKNALNKVKKIDTMKKSLISYPIVSLIVWIIYFILQILAGYIRDGGALAESMKTGAGAWFLIIVICIRQIVFTLVYFFSQGNLKKYSLYYLKFQCFKKKKSETISSINKVSTNRLLNDKEEENE